MPNVLLLVEPKFTNFSALRPLLFYFKNALSIEQNTHITIHPMLTYLSNAIKTKYKIFHLWGYIWPTSTSL